MKVLLVAPADCLAAEEKVVWLLDSYTDNVANDVRAVTPYENVLGQCIEYRPDLILDFAFDIKWSSRFMSDLELDEHLKSIPYALINNGATIQRAEDEEIEGQNSGTHNFRLESKLFTTVN